MTSGLEYGVCQPSPSHNIHCAAKLCKGQWWKLSDVTPCFRILPVSLRLMDNKPTNKYMEDRGSLYRLGKNYLMTRSRSLSWTGQGGLPGGGALWRTRRSWQGTRRMNRRVCEVSAPPSHALPPSTPHPHTSWQGSCRFTFGLNVGQERSIGEGPPLPRGK